MLAIDIYIYIYMVVYFQILYPLRVKPTFESADGEGGPLDVVIQIEDSDAPLITTAPVKKTRRDTGGSRDAHTSNIQFQALESGYKRQSGFWVSLQC